MSLGDGFILMGVGGFFIILGLAVTVWGRREEKGYFDSIATRTDDLREFVEHWPSRPQPGALKTGGRIAIIIGLLILVTGVTLWLLG
ncbi:hypothetical protein ACFLUZ_04185 [Chloroflexota bacterium]